MIIEASEKEIKEFEEKFMEIKKMGYIKGLKPSTKGNAGLTYELLLGKDNDGGDVEFEKFEDGICYVKLKGACAGCMFADMTIQNTVEEMLISEVPEVIKVINVKEA